MGGGRVGSRRGRSEGAESEGEGFRGGGGLSRVIKLLYAPAPPPPTVWALKSPSWALHLLGLSNICVCTLHT
jgi:hypothetical protein